MGSFNWKDTEIIRDFQICAELWRLKLKFDACHAIDNDFHVKV
jgi:hypothetical protein